jgi:hypothetical protein
VAPELPAAVGPSAGGATEADRLALFHRLNNQLGVILANAELLETRLSDDLQRQRAAQVVQGAMDAISTVQNLRQMLTVD